MVTLLINSVNCDDVLRAGSWKVSKRATSETFTFTVQNSVWSDLAFRPAVGDEVHLTHGYYLTFGGLITKVREYRADGEGPTFVDVTCRDYNYLAEQILVSGKITSSDHLETLYELFETWLEPKGCSWLGDMNGGEDIGTITYTKITLAELFNRISKLTNWPWRINGNKEFKSVEPGSLPFTKTPMYGTDFLRGLEINQDFYEYGTRLTLTTGGTGDATHSETHSANGVKKFFLLNVWPKAKEYDEDGNLTASYDPTSVTVDGSSVPIDGATWFYDEIWNAVFTTGTAPSTSVVASYTISFPAEVQVWNSSIINSNGEIIIADLIDKRITIGDITDVSEAKRWGDVELVRRGLTPKKINGVTRIVDYYPFQVGNIILPEHGINSSFMVENVEIYPLGIDPSLTDEELAYSLDLIEGNVAGRNWTDLFKEMLGGGGGGGSISSSGGGSGGSGGGVPAGMTVHVGGSNVQSLEVTTSWVDVAEAIPCQIPGGSGSWSLRVPLYQIGSGTMEVRLRDITNGVDLANVSSTATGTHVDNGFFDYETDSFSAPPATVEVLLQVRVASGTRYVVVGHSTMVKL